jgi:predicted P-loop ATPase
MKSPENSEEILPTPNPTIQQAVSAQFIELPTPLNDHTTTYFLDNVKRLDPFSFPHQQPNANSKLPGTLPNIRHLLKAHNIIVRYNTITKKLDIIIPNYTGSPDNSDSIKLTIVSSLAAANNMSTSSIPSLLEAIGDRNLYNPVADWINSKPWDGVDRIESMYSTLVHREDFPEELKKILMRCWFISLVAAALKPSGFHARGVLTLQGPQSIGKTSWIRALINNALLAENVIKLDHHLDAGNKDSLITAITHWIVEIGELDSSFKKDIARLKGFLTAGSDKLRRPYGRTNAEYQRRTVFCATVNDENFLVDTTGNTRWWTIPVTSIDYQHTIEMQQLFAQVATYYRDGEQWWLTKSQEEMLEMQNKNHRSMSSIHERILDILAMEHAGETGLPAMTASQILLKLDIRSPSQAQFKECHTVLRELLGMPKKISGSMCFRVPLKENYWKPPSKIAKPVDDADLY